MNAAFVKCPSSRNVHLHGRSRIHGRAECNSFSSFGDTRCVKMSKSDVEALCKLARDCLQLQQVKQAKELYDKAIAEDVDSAEAHDGLAAIALMDSDYPTAITHYLKLTLLHPAEARNYTNLGAIYNRTREYPKAVDALRQ